MVPSFPNLELVVLGFKLCFENMKGVFGLRGARERLGWVCLRTNQSEN